VPADRRDLTALPGAAGTGTVLSAGGYRQHAAGRALPLAQSVQNLYPDFLVDAHLALGETLFWLGELIPSREHVEQGGALYHPQQHRSHAFLYVQDPGMACRGYASWALWHLGYPDQALNRCHEALTLARELSHPYSLAIALVFAARLNQLRREGRAVQEQAEGLIL
jgi:hypothetical protein